MNPRPQHQPSEPRVPWASRDIAEAWRQSGAAGRDEAYAQATELLLDLAGVHEGSRVLDVAAGAGGQALAAARRVGPTGYVLATDLSSAMLEVAAEAIREAGLTNAETRVMDGQQLALDAESFDAAISRNGLMLMSDPRKALAELRRVLRVGGRAAALVFSSPERNPYIALPQIIVRRIGNLPEPAPDKPGQFALSDPRRLEELLKQAGFRDVAIHTIPVARHFSSVAEAFRAVKEMTISLRWLIAKLSDAQREQAWAEIERELKQFEGPHGCDLPGESLVGVGSK